MCPVVQGVIHHIVIASDSYTPTHTGTHTHTQRHTEIQTNRGEPRLVGIIQVHNTKMRERGVEDEDEDEEYQRIIF